MASNPEENFKRWTLAQLQPFIDEGVVHKDRKKKKKRDKDKEEKKER